MSDLDYIIMDIETIPLDLKKHFSLEENERLKLLNPIDSRVIAIGLRYKNKDKIFMGANEKDILEKFWLEWKNIRNGRKFPLVGFNITNFDIPFVVARSFINNVKIQPFSLKEIIDLRDKINAYKYGPTRGKLKEFAKLLDIKILDVNGSDVASLCLNENYDKLKEYLKKDLEITDKLYLRAVETNIIKISKW